MKLTRMLATAAIGLTLSLGATAQAKSKKHHSSKSAKKPTPAAVMDPTADAEAPAVGDAATGGGAAAAAGATTTTTTKTDDTSAGSAAGDTSGGSSSTTTTETTVTPPIADPAVPPPDAPPPPVVVQPVEVAPATPAPTHSIVFLPIVAEHDRAMYGYTPPIGIAVMAGGGTFDFVGGSIKSATSMGGSWNVRALVGSRSLVALEASYLGTAQSIQSLGVTSNSSTLLSNGVEGALRLNAPIAVKRFLIEPFGFAGAGWSHYSISTNNAFTASLRNTDDVVTLPVGGGIEMGYSGFFLDARYTYRFSYNNDLVLVGDAGMDNWTAAGSVGFEF